MPPGVLALLVGNRTDGQNEGCCTRAHIAQRTAGANILSGTTCAR